MEEDVRKLEENYEVGKDDIQGGDLEGMELVSIEIPNNSDQIPLEAGEDDTSTDPNYRIRDGRIYKMVGGSEILLANFYLEIVGQQIWIDEGTCVRRDMIINVHLNGTAAPLTISSEDFCSHRLVNRIVEAVGPDAIIYGNHRELRLAAQELSPSPIPRKTITSSMGFNEEGVYLAPGLSISTEGINDSPEVDVDLSRELFFQILRLIRGRFLHFDGPVIRS